MISTSEYRNIETGAAAKVNNYELRPVSLGTRPILDLSWERKLLHRQLTYSFSRTAAVRYHKSEVARKACLSRFVHQLNTACFAALSGRPIENRLYT